MTNLYNEFSLALYTTVWNVLALQTNFVLALTIIFLLSYGLIKFAKHLGQELDIAEDSVDYWETSYHSVFGILIKKETENKNLKELNDKLLKANTSLTKEIKIYIPEKKKTWTKKREGTLSRSQVYRRKKADKLPKNWGRIKEVSF